MSLTNSKSAYGWLSILLHWISAVGVIWLYFLGEGIEHAKEDRLPREEIISAVQLHMSVGLCFFLFLAARVITSLVQTRPEPFPQHRYLTLLSLFVQRLWLLMIAVQIISGPLLVWTGGGALKIFDKVTIPSPLGKMEGLHEILETVHALTPNLFWPLLVLHVAGVLKHLVIDRDRTLQRMLWVRNG